MKNYLTVRDVAKNLNVKEETVRRWLRKGLLQGTSLGRAGYRIEAASLDAFLQLQHPSTDPHLTSLATIASVEIPLDAENWHCLDELADGFFVLDKDWHFVFLNPTAARMFGKAGENLLGRNFWFYFDFLLDTPLFRTFITAMQEGQAGECDEVALAPGYWLHVRVHPIDKGIAVFLIDTTERKKTELHEAYLARIVRSSDMVIFSVTSSGVITSWNHGAELFYGYRAEEVLGRSIAFITSPGHSVEQVQMLTRLHRDRHADFFATVHVHKSGCELPVSLRLSPLPDTQNISTTVVMVNHDLTIWKEILARLLLHKERHFQAVKHSLQYGMWIADACGGLEYASQSFLNLLKMTLSDCQRQGWYHLVPQDEVPLIQATWQRSWEKGELWMMVYHLHGYDGHVYTILSNGQPVYDTTGKIVRWVGFHLSIEDASSFQQVVANRGE